VRALTIVLFLATPACITPNVLDKNARAVEAPPAQIAWQAAKAADFNGLFESTSIEGEAAASLWKIYYHFANDGTFTGAALVIGGPQPAFQTLSGTWKLDERGLDLGDGQLVRAFATAEQLKIEHEGDAEVPGGVVILRRVAMQ
jgi:hypothetical protein